MAHEPPKKRGRGRPPIGPRPEGWEPKKDERGLIPQPHGGALLPPTAPRPLTSFRAVRKEALGILAEGTPAGARRLVQMAESDDERVAIIAIGMMHDRVIGRPNELPQANDDVSHNTGSIPVKFLTAEERAELMQHLRRVAELQAIARERAAIG